MRRILRIFKRILLKFVPLRFQSLYHSLIVKEYNELSTGEVQFFVLIRDFVECMVDVGARTDTFYANSPVRPGKNRKVFMFEANPAFAGRLVSTTPSLGNQNFVHNVAIGKEPGNLYYFYDSQSFVEKSNVGTVSRQKSNKPIEVRTLDSFSKEISKIDFLKTDIEEMDFYALLGASSTLPNIHFIQFELGLGMPHNGRRVQNFDYWELLEKDFKLFILQDANPLWGTFPTLPLLLELNFEAKMAITILQSLGYGFNIVGINEKMGIPDSLNDYIGVLADLSF